MSDDIVITPRLRIPLHEIRFSATRSSGPGGQHVNTTDTRVELRWNVQQSAVLSEQQRERIQATLSSRINRRGELIVSSGTRRSQHHNRQEVIARFATLLRHALAPRKRRRRTERPAAAHEERLRQKRRRAEIKRGRHQTEQEE